VNAHRETNAGPEQAALATELPGRPAGLTPRDGPLSPAVSPDGMATGRRPDEAADPVAAELAPHLVALLFAADEPLALPDAARILGARRRDVERAAALLAEAPPLGLMLQRDGGRLQLATTPASAPYVRRLRGLEEQGRLSRAALEVLAVVAYRQPITRAEIEAVRGVGGDRALATLLQRELIEEVGRKETVGRPVLFGTTLAFLEHAGLRSLADLPPLPAPDGRALAEPAEASKAGPPLAST
jgi:segregation and condensation protein B